MGFRQTVTRITIENLYKVDSAYFTVTIVLDHNINLI